MTVGPLLAVDPLDVGDYVLEGRLGRGGQAVVYLARDAAGDAVAVKVFDRDWLTDPAARAQLAVEAQAMRGVAPFGTARLLAAHLEADPPYLVSEYVPGMNLEQAVRTRGPLRGGELYRFALAVLTGLRAIHAGDLVHRDLKPSNLVLGPDGPRIVDFGIAARGGSPAAAPADDGVLGTRDFLAPELLDGGPVTPAVDVHAWAATVAFAAAGRVPDAAWLAANPEAPLPGLSPALSGVLRRCLGSDPAQRPGLVEVTDLVLAAAHADRSLVDEPPGPSVPSGSTVPSGVSVPRYAPVPEVSSAPRYPSPSASPSPVPSPVPAWGTPDSLATPGRAVDSPNGPGGVSTGGVPARPGTGTPGGPLPTPHRPRGARRRRVPWWVGLGGFILVVNLIGGNGDDPRGPHMDGWGPDPAYPPVSGVSLPTERREGSDVPGPAGNRLGDLSVDGTGPLALDGCSVVRVAPSGTTTEVGRLPTGPRPDCAGQDVAASPDGRSLAVTDREGITVLPADGDGVGVRLEDSADDDEVASHLTWSADGTTLAALVRGRPTVWRPADGQDDLRSPSEVTGASLAVDRNGDRVVMVVEGMVEVWDPTDDSVFSFATSLPADAPWALSPDGTRIAAVDRARDVIVVLEVDSGEPVLALDAMGLDYRAVSFDPTGRSVVAASSDVIIHVWDAASGDPDTSWPSLVDPGPDSVSGDPVDVELTRNGDRVYVLRQDGSITTWTRP